MSTNLIQIKNYLGKYYPELKQSTTQEKYTGAGISTFFEQRFHIQDNKVQMIVDPMLNGLTAIISGNEVHISKELYDHPHVEVTNSLEAKEQLSNPKSLYAPDTFSTVAYLVCQNHTMLRVTGELDEPVYLKYKSDFESFYNSVIIIELMDGVDLELVEEIESSSALNALTNYILHTASTLSLSTIYNNNKSAISFVYRNIISMENSRLKHCLLGKGSSNVIDETKIVPYSGAKAELLGVINSNGQQFHSILSVHPTSIDYGITVDYRDILYGKADITYFPAIIGYQQSLDSSISVSNINVDEIEPESVSVSVNDYIKEVMDRTVLTRTQGVKRFYNNKLKFSKFP